MRSEPAASPRRPSGAAYLARRLLLPLLLAALGAACASAGSTAGPGARPPHAAALRVENYNWSDMVVYTLDSGGRHRLGAVGALSARSFSLRPGLDAPSGTLRLYAESIGAGTSYTAPPLATGPGERVTLVLENDASLSRVVLDSDAR